MGCLTTENVFCHIFLTSCTIIWNLYMIVLIPRVLICFCIVSLFILDIILIVIAYFILICKIFSCIVFCFILYLSVLILSVFEYLHVLHPVSVDKHSLWWLDFSFFGNLVSEVMLIFIFENPILSHFWAAFQIIVSHLVPIYKDNFRLFNYFDSEQVSQTQLHLSLLFWNLYPLNSDIIGIWLGNIHCLRHTHPLRFSNLPSAAPAIAPSLWSFDIVSYCLAPQ